MYKLLRYTQLFFGVAAVALIATSCAPTKNAAYFRMQEEIPMLNEPDKVYSNEKDSTYVLKPGDELYVTVTTSDNEVNNFTSGQIGFTDIEMLSYLIDQEGFVKLPYIGRMKITEKTLEEAATVIETELSQYLYQPVVTMKLVNARITVLGEVTTPGVFSINNKPINIYQALGYAGDITTYGNRKNVLIVRENSDSVVKKYIDLTNDEILGTVWYTLEPNDIIYVEPMARKMWGMETFPWGIVTSAISSTILIMTFTISLIN